MSESGGSDGKSSSTSCNMFVRAASTIASESRLGCDCTLPVGAWDAKDGPGAVAAAATPSPSPACATEEVEAYAAGEGSGGISAAESKT
jgi:hypothetical protein